MLKVVQRQYAGHWPIWCVVDDGRVLLCRQTEKEAGEMLRDMEKAKGGQPKKNRCNDVTSSFDSPTLSEIGITKRQSSEVRP